MCMCMCMSMRMCPHTHTHTHAHTHIHYTYTYTYTYTYNFVEVWVKASVDECIKRDPKGLYKKAIAGEIKNLTGLQAPYEEPENAEIIIDTEAQTVEESIKQIISKLKKLEYLK